MIPLRDENPTSRRPVVTLAIIVVCTFVYFFVQPSPLSDTTDDVTFRYDHAAIPLELRQQAPLTNCQVFRAAATAASAAEVCAADVGQQPFAPGKKIWLAVIVSMFLHASVWHLGGNLLFLWVFGNNVEDRLGHVAFAAFYLVGGIVATFGYTVTNLSSALPVLGASGAVAATMGAYLVWYPRARIRTLIFVILVFWPRIEARWVLLIWFVLQFFTNPNSGVAWVAHVTGFAFGAALGLLLGPGRRTRAIP